MGAVAARRNGAGAVVVFGSLNVDSTSYVDAFPAPGETILAHDFRVALGGKGANQAVAAHVAGLPVEFVACVGDDASGAFARETLERLGVPMTAVRLVPDAPTGVAQITVADSGENTVIVTGGANLALTPEMVEAERERVAAAALVLTQGELPVPTIERVAVIAAEFGARFVLNLAPPAPVSAETLRVADPLVLNEHEARAVGIGTDAPSDATLDEWRALAASAAGVVARSIVVTLGGAGAVAADAAGSWAAPAPRVTAVDTTGAGDGFTGTLAAFLAEGRSLPEALRIAVAAGALAVQARGTVDSYAPRDTVLAASSASDAAASPLSADTDLSAEPASTQTKE
ncbi:ribokinase [Agromyces badenianii]|uniref:Ribokinase n=1 Tax=Agromyces badenianii TaxID=2080742 RepID=A0A2S0WYU8_9MICO|nr:ribokinase [Agromyces badenianii]AWB96537.1 ribokinase [Agromyces badenianii]